MDMKSISQKLQDDIRAIMEAGLHPNQQKIDVHEPEKDEITAHDFKKLRAMKKDKTGKITKEDTDDQIQELAGKAAQQAAIAISLIKAGKKDGKMPKPMKEEEEKKKVVSPFDYKNYKSQIPKKPGELTGHDSKKTSTGTVYTKRPVKENTDIDEARLPRALHKMSADELNQAHKDNEAEIEAIHKNDPSKRITMNHPLISKRRSINLHKVIRSKQSNPNYIPPKAHGYSEEVEIGEARKLEGTYSHTNGNQSKVYKLSGEHHEGDPYHVKLFKAGKHYEPADYFTNDKDDAHGTAKHMVKEESHQSKTTMKHIPNASPALKKAAKDIKPGIAGYRDRVAMLKAGGVKEEVEELDELSKTTLGSYAKKATRDAVITRKIGADFEHQSKRAKSPGMKAASDEMSQKYKEKSWKRRDGVDKAVDRLTKEDVEIDEGSGPKEKQKTPFRNINGPEYKAAADKQRQQMAKDKAAEPGKKMLSKQMAKHEEVEQNEYTFADYLDAVRAQYGDEDAVLIANEAFKNQDITLFSDQSQSPEA